MSQNNKEKWLVQINKDFIFGYIKETEKIYNIHQETLNYLVNSLQKKPCKEKAYKIDFKNISQKLEGIYIEMIS